MQSGGHAERENPTKPTGLDETAQRQRERPLEVLLHGASVIVPHPLDIIAVLLGIFLAIRKSDVRGEELARHPGVRPEDFALWQSRMTSAYTIGIRACFVKVIADFAYLAVLRRVALDIFVQRAVGVTLDLAWLVAMIACWVLVRRARQFAKSARIDLSGAQPSSEGNPG